MFVLRLKLFEDCHVSCLMEPASHWTVSHVLPTGLPGMSPNTLLWEYVRCGYDGLEPIRPCPYNTLRGIPLLQLIWPAAVKIKILRKTYLLTTYGSGSGSDT